MGQAEGRVEVGSRPSAASPVADASRRRNRGAALSSQTCVFARSRTSLGMLRGAVLRACLLQPRGRQRRVVAVQSCIRVPGAVTRAPQDAVAS